MIRVPVLLPDNIDPSDTTKVSEFLNTVKLYPISRAKLAQLTDVDLIDTVGVARQHKKSLEAFDNAAKIALDTRFGTYEDATKPLEVSAYHFRMSMSLRSRTGLDSEKIKAEMGEKWVAEHSKTTSYKEFRFPPREGEESGYQ